MSDRAGGREESDGEEPPSEPGDVLAGKYRVERVLGVGGMGKVVAAVHIELLERRAIKFMHARHLDDAEAVGRFLREARAISRLVSEHVVKVHDVGRLENGAPYMVMEHLRGRDLGAELALREVLPPEEATLYVLQTCEALAEAHAAGIIHRDLKPENLFLARDRALGRSIKVLDFGISKVADDPGDLRMTRTAAIMGSPHYMSPEQTQASRDVDARADVWSLGVVLYQLVTGHLPFNGKNLTEIVAAIILRECPLASARVPSIPPALDAIILRCLEKDRALRYASVAELAADLAPLAPPAADRSLQRIARFAIHVEDSISAAAVSSDPVVPAIPTAPPRRALPARVLAAGIALAIGFAGSALVLSRIGVRRAPEPPAASPVSAALPSPEPSVAAPPSPRVSPSAAASPPPESSIEVVPAPPRPALGPTRPGLPPAIKAPPRASAKSPQPSPPAEPTGDPFGTGRR